MQDILSLILSELGGRRLSDNKIQCKCPAHPDTTPSLSVTLKDHKLLYYCHSGCSQDAVGAALKARGLVATYQPKPIKHYHRSL